MKAPNMRQVTLLLPAEIIPHLQAHATKHRMGLGDFLIACWQEILRRRTNVLKDAPWPAEQWVAPASGMYSFDSSRGSERI